MPNFFARQDEWMRREDALKADRHLIQKIYPRGETNFYKRVRMGIELTDQQRAEIWRNMPNEA